MRTSPPIAPSDLEHATYLVLDDFGRIGRAWREAAEEAADRETVIRNLLAGEYNDPARIVAFNTAEGWSRDVSMEIADELRQRFIQDHQVSDSILQFLQAHQH